jgi:putative copper export protein
MSPLLAAAAQLASPIDTIRITLHVLAAMIWVGGQLVLLGLVPVLRAAGGDIPKAAARAFNRIAWPAFGVLLVTGVWNEFSMDNTGALNYRITRAIKLGFVALSGLGAFLHTRAKGPAMRGVWGGVGLIGAIGATITGVVLAG